MKQKSILHTNRSVQDQSRPAVFVNDTKKKVKSENQIIEKEKQKQKQNN